MQDIHQRTHELKKKKEDHLSDSGTSGYESCSSDDLSERERRLAYLKRLAKDLEASIAPGCSAWKEINSVNDIFFYFINKILSVVSNFILELIIYIFIKIAVLFKNLPFL